MERNQLTPSKKPLIERLQVLARHIGFVMKLPRGLREQPGWVFIGAFCAIVGASYLLGFSQSMVTAALDPKWIRVWGTGLCLTGIVIVYATIRRNRALERLSLRLLAVGLLVYMGWILTVVPERAAMTVFMCSSLIISSQLRVAVLGIHFESPPESESKVVE